MTEAIVKKRDAHIRKHPADGGEKPVWCGAVDVGSISEAWGFWGPSGDGYDDVCRGCINEQQRVARRGGR